MEVRGEGRLLRVRVDAITPPESAARREFSQASIGTLADSIRRHGLICPVLVRPVPGGYQLIAGERRLRAVKELGLTTIDAMVVGAPAGEAALLTLVENVQRENLHYLEEAEALRSLQDKFGFSQQALSACLGVSQPQISNRIRLLGLARETRAALYISGLSERHARALLKLSDPQAQMTALVRARDEKMTVRQLEGLVEKLAARRPKNKHVRVYLRDHRLLVNAVLGAVKSLNAAGIQATSRVVEKPDCVEVIVSMPLTPGR